MDVWSYRHRKDNEPFVDEINNGIRDIQSDFPDIMNFVQAVAAGKLGGRDRLRVLGYYGQGALGLNREYTKIDKMNAVYDSAVASGFHPPRGSMSGTRAVTLHEMGHALTDFIAQKMGASGIDDAAARLVEAAYKAAGGKGGANRWRGKISGYAKESAAEAVAEAVADVYCNGNNASKESKAIVNEMRRWR